MVEKYSIKIRKKIEKLDVELKGILTNDVGKIMAIVFIFIISFLLLTLLPNISQSYESYLFNILYLTIYIPLIFFNVDTTYFLLLLQDVIFIFLHITEFSILTIWAVLFYGILISVFVMIGFYVLSTWINFYFKVKRTKTQDIFRVFFEAIGIGLGMVLIIYLLPLPTYFYQSGFGLLNMMNIEQLPINLFASLSLNSSLVAVDILLRVFLLFCIIYSFVFLEDLIFYAYRKYRKIELVQIPAYSYELEEVK